MSEQGIAQRVTVLGAYVKGDGYPNVLQRLIALQQLADLEVKEINYPFQSATNRAGIYGSRFLRLARFVVAHAAIALRLPFLGTGEVVYVPYPAALVLWIWSLLPKALRPKRVVVDAFISWYDTAVEDRGLLKAKGFGARLLKRMEARAYRFADQVLVDTPLNREYFISLFALEPDKVIALPLAIDEMAYSASAYEPVPGRCTVLFVGTFVPLQGVDIIVAAMRVLANRTDINFRIIGHGQTAQVMEEITSEQNATRITWITDWLSADQVAGEIARADICLGIFGSGAKTQRVWPLKNYAYMSVGRALISGDTACARQMQQGENGLPFVAVPCADPTALAQAIERLVATPMLRVDYAQRARSYYERQLSMKRTQELLFGALFQ